MRNKGPIGCYDLKRLCPLLLQRRKMADEREEVIDSRSSSKLVATLGLEVPSLMSHHSET